MFSLMLLDATLQGYESVQCAFDHSVVFENFCRLQDSVLAHDVDCVTHENVFDVPN